MSLKIIRVETFKYPDIPRYFFPAAVVTERPDYFMIYHPAGAPLWSGKDQRLYRTRHHHLALLYPDHDYNLSLFWTEIWELDSYYINIALPTEWGEEECSFIDLELDVLWLTEGMPRVQTGRSEAGVFVLDRDEYELHKLKYNYPPELMERTEAAVLEVLAQISLRAFPFDDSLIGWRPTPEMLRLADLPDSAGLWHLEKLPPEAKSGQ